MVGLFIRTSDDIFTREATEAAIASLRRYTARSNGILMEDKTFSVLAFMEERLVGGLLGKVFWNWLNVDLLWVEEEFRRRGIGTDVMSTAEERARKMQLTGMYLSTETWQGTSFYMKHGYSQIDEFKNCPPGHSRLGFCKYLG